ncbi:MAG: YgjV family protein [Eubacterium sp.]|nr:YgjV family protein [Eubacterium sp.]
MTFDFHTLLIQTIGFAAAAMLIFSYQTKTNRGLLIWQILGNLTFAIQFLLLGGLTGTLSLFVIICRNLTSLKYHDWAWVRTKWWIVLWLIVAASVMAVTWNGPVSLLPFLGACAGIFGYSTNDAQKIRLCTLVLGSPAWILYDILVGSWGGILNETVTVISVLVSIYRYGWKNMGGPDSSFNKKTKNNNP